MAHLLLFEKPEEIMPILDGIKKYDKAQDEDFDTITKNLAFLKGKVYDGKMDQILDCDWVHLFQCWGFLTYEVIKNLHEGDFLALLSRKHQAYGAAPLIAWGPLGIAIRIDSKINRYKNLVAQKTDLSAREASYNDESIGDTLADILGYCVLGVMLEYKREEKHPKFRPE